MNIFDTFFLTVNAWMTSGSAMAYVGCFAWGMISVLFSPCHLASIPLVVAYVAGQESALNPKQACLYAGAFASGLFATISLIGVICAGLGRLLGDVGPWWQVLVGAVLIWVALGMLGVQSCQLSGTLMYRMKLRGIHGAFGLGLAYGLISGSCTFGFIAPILAIITIQKQWATGVLMMLLFALGHCLPIMVAGSSTAVVRKLTENHLLHNAGNWFRRGAGAVIALLGVYFVFNPFIGT